MIQKYAYLFLSLGISTSGICQELHKHFEASKSSADKVSLNITTKAGKSFINAVESDKPVVVFGGNENDFASSTFKIESEGKTQSIQAKLACKEHAGDNFTEAIASNIFGGSKADNDLWQVNLSEDISFNLDLNYLVGSSQIDLSNLSIERLKIKSGSADVFVKYSNQQANAVAMDTFFIKVNMGTIDVEDLDLASAKEIIAEVGFGSINLDCGNHWKMNSHINASVGAGSMVITLPENDVPVLVKLNDSPLCHVKMGKSFQKVGHNAYGNEAYRNDKTNSIEFSLDVGMGSISFVDK
jgi:ribosomal protein S4E